MTASTSIPLSRIAAVLQLPAPSSPELLITGMATLAEAGPTDLSFLGADAYLKDFAVTQAAAVLVHKRVKLPADRNPRPIVLVVDDADLAVARALELFAPPIAHPPTGIHPSALVDPTAVISPTAAIGPQVTIGARAVIGDGCSIYPGVRIEEDVILGTGCIIYSNVVLRQRVTLGNRVIINAGSVLGTDGFGYRWNGTEHAKIPQIGTVIIEDDVEIGSCVCIDRAKFSSTRIGRGTKIDNLVQIGHNVQIGPHCIIVGQVGIAGSARLGVGVVLGGQTAVRDHVVIGDGAMSAACSAIAEDIEPKTIVSGMPALPHRQSLREQAAIRRLPELVTQVRKLTDEIEQIRKSLA